ncbi:hypothetical protein V8E53_007684, partial [Lactarius tabidus]
MPRRDASTVVAILELTWVIEGCFTRTAVACRGHDDSGWLGGSIYQECQPLRAEWGLLADLTVPSMSTTEIEASARIAASWGLLSSI